MRAYWLPQKATTFSYKKNCYHYGVSAQEAEKESKACKRREEIRKQNTDVAGSAKIDEPTPKSITSDESKMKTCVEVIIKQIFEIAQF